MTPTTEILKISQNTKTKSLGGEIKENIKPSKMQREILQKYTT
jgi:hypothetical protein